MAITHIVMWAFKPLTTAQEAESVSARMLALKDKCIHPETKKPYIKSSVGGTNNSTEGRTRGITHIFVSEFENEADREYYLEKDPAHLEFVKGLVPVAEVLQVVDFTPGAFELAR